MRKRLCFRSFCMSWLLLLGSVLGAYAESPRSKAVNVTQSIDRMELDPAFVSNGREIVFMAFSGERSMPEFWDYRIARIDRDGGKLEYLTADGVLEYRIDAEGERLVYLFVPSNSQGAFGEISIELRLLDLETLEMEVLSTTRRNYNELADMLLRSEGECESVSATLTPQPIRFFARGSELVLSDRCTNQELLVSDRWWSQIDYAWQPEIVSMDETTFLVTTYLRESDTFAIVHLDVNTGDKAVIYESSKLHPFPKMAIDPAGKTLYFKEGEIGAGAVRLRRLSLVTGAVETIYTAQEDLGRLRFTDDGSAVVFSQFSGGNFDIIRLELPSESLLLAVHTN